MGPTASYRLIDPVVSLADRRGSVDSGRLFVRLGGRVQHPAEHVIFGVGGTILHMDPRAIEKARSRLRTARRALETLRECADATSFADHWYTYLVAAKGVYTQLEQGSKASPQSRQWFGGKKAERKSTPLLQYMYQARHDEEHGLDQSIRYQPFSVDPSPNVTSYTSTWTEDEKGPIHEVTVTLKDPSDIRITGNFATMQLTPVTGRGNITYYPPVSVTDGEDSVMSPDEAATNNLNYLSELIELAAARV